MGEVVSITDHVAARTAKSEHDRLLDRARAGERLNEEEWCQIDLYDSFTYGFSARLFISGERKYIDPAEVIDRHIGQGVQPRRDAPPN